jgi:hypothetical protein
LFDDLRNDIIKEWDEGNGCGTPKTYYVKRLFGVKPETFEAMKSILYKEFENLHRQGGGPPKLSVEDKLTITLKYFREYRTMESIGHDYWVGKSTVCESI